MKKIYMYCAALMLTLSVFHCGEKQETYETKPLEVMPDEYAVKDGYEAFMGELIYVPVYSSVYHIDNERTMLLSATLSIHNTDLEKGISIKRINYYSS